jgi:aryl-alcohol dehydrogenase-like predicted oxidoreductase
VGLPLHRCLAARWRRSVGQGALAGYVHQELGETRGYLGDRLAPYQVHSLTEDSGALSDAALLSALAGLRDDGVLIGLSTSGPRQADTLRRALAVTVGGKPLFSATEVTWNLLEPTIQAAAAALCLIMATLLPLSRAQPTLPESRPDLRS